MDLLENIETFEDEEVRAAPEFEDELEDEFVDRSEARELAFTPEVAGESPIGEELGELESAAYEELEF